MAKSKASDKEAGKAKADSASPSVPVEESLAEIAARSDEPVVSVTRVMQRFPPPEEKIPSEKPDVVLKTEVIWGELPKDPPPKPVRDAVVATTHVMERSAPPKKGPPSIGSMQPPK